MSLERVEKAWNELKAEFDIGEGVEDSAMLIIASLAGAGTSDVYARTSSTLEMMGFIIPVFIMIVFLVTVMKAWIRANDPDR